MNGPKSCKKVIAYTVLYQSLPPKYYIWPMSTPSPRRIKKNSGGTTEKHVDRWQIAGVWGIPGGEGVDIGQI